MKRILKKSFLCMALTLILASCFKDLNKGPIDPNTYTPDNVYTNPAAYKQVLAKLYAGLSVSGQQGPSGNADISGIDEGFGEYMRAYWYHQELPTDEAVIGWNDQTVKNFHSLDWGSGDVFIAAMYYRIFYQISICNEFIRESTNDKLDSRGISGQDKINIGYYRAEARFLRALSYYHALDFFGNVPFVTENDIVGKFFPPRIKRADLYAYIEKELLDIEPLMIGARQNDYGRADQACVWTLLSKLYLNSEVYIGQAKYTECINYCNKVIAAGYTLEPTYANLFLADNNNSHEIIFPVEYDGMRTRTYGGTTFIIHAAVGGSMVTGDFGIAGGWGGTRTTKHFVNLFYPSLLDRPSWSSPKPVKKTRSYTLLFVPGSYQTTPWTPSDSTTVLASVHNDGNFEGYINFPAGADFKFTQGPNWDVNWGDNGPNDTLDLNGANIHITDAGYYKINVNLNNLSYTLVKTTWGVIGDATAGGWSSDQPMTYDPVSGTWNTTLDLVVGGLKFRANGAWDINYGDTGNDGILDAGGDNIAIPAAGTFVITMKLGVPDYTYTIVKYVPPPPPSVDSRAMFWTDGQSLEIKDIGTFTDGYAITKFKNVTSTGVKGSDGTYCDTDFPMFRLGDVYLMYAEAVERGGTGGDLGTAVGLINDLRLRAYGDASGNIAAGDLTDDFILDERGRELYWEGYRRTDLIRHGKFTSGSYLWQWKGGVANGTGVSDFYSLFPIPSSDVTANPNLIQNAGY